MTFGYCGLPFAYPPLEEDIDGIWDEEHHIEYVGKATLQPDGTWRAVAKMDGALFLVQVTLRSVEKEAG